MKDPKAKPMYVGKRGDPELEALLTEMDDEFASAGIRNFTAAEVTKMRKSPGPSFAIPSRPYWPRMIRTLQLMQRIRDDWGKPIDLYNGFRPADYNKAVGGEPGSRHQWFEAVDATADDMEAFALLVASYYVAEGGPDRMGFGVYGGAGTPIRGVHVDTGHRRRTWGSADYYVAKARAVA